MTFNILEYLERFEVIRVFPSQYTCACPLCSGKLQISRTKEGAYKCFGEGCSSEAIREWLGAEKRNTSSSFFNPAFTRITTPILVSNGSLYIHDQLSKDFYVEEIEIEDYMKFFQLYKQKKFCREKKIKKVVYTFYYYSDKFRVVRVDFYSKRKREEKMFFPEFKEDGKWSSSRNFSPEYKIENDCFYHFKHLKKYPKQDVVLIVEGEKCCEALSCFGIIALSPPGYGWSVKWIREKLQSISYYFSQIIIIPDNDEPGYKKAFQFQEQAWKLDIPCSILEIGGVKEDVSDLINRDAEKAFTLIQNKLIEIGVKVETYK